MPKTLRNKKNGGGSSSGYGTYVWGTGNQQHAVGNGNNLIAALNDPTTYKGGKRRSAKKGGDLATIAVPAVLIAANHLYRPKKQFRNIKKGGADMMGDISKMMHSANEVAGSIGVPTTPPQHSVVQVTQLPTNVTPVGIAKVGGDGPILQEQPPVEVQALLPNQVGAGILTDIAAPAVLIAANHLYNPSKRHSKKNKRRSTRKSRRM
jgi:hypothetical protein